MFYFPVGKWCAVVVGNSLNIVVTEWQFVNHWLVIITWDMGHGHGNYTTGMISMFSRLWQIYTWVIFWVKLLSALEYQNWPKKFWENWESSKLLDLIKKFSNATSYYLSSNTFPNILNHVKICQHDLIIVSQVSHHYQHGWWQLL